MDKEYLEEFAKQYQKKYNHALEVQRLTKELGDVLSRDDRVSAGLVLGMRQQELEGMEACEKSVALLLESLPAGERETVKALLEAGASSDAGEDDALVSRIRSIREKTDHTLRDTVALDKAINRRIAGKDSFYANGAEGSGSG